MEGSGFAVSEQSFPEDSPVPRFSVVLVVKGGREPNEQYRPDRQSALHDEMKRRFSKMGSSNRAIGTEFALTPKIDSSVMSIVA